MGRSVKELLLVSKVENLRLRLAAGRGGLNKEITTPRIQKSGLLLTGLLDEIIHPGRVQILGAAELGFLKSLSGKELDESLKILEKPEIPAMIITRGIEPPEFLKELAEKNDIPLFVTPLTSSLLIEGLTKYLEEELAPTTTIHGVLVDVLGVGILITGRSGIGKSECALELVTRGFRLVSDDAVIVKRLPPGTLVGTASEMVRYHIEVRGLGIVNIKDLYGITAIRTKKQLDLVVELVNWKSDEEYERLGIDDKTYKILDVELPYLRIPVSPGRSVATIVEVAARNQILKIMGYHSSRAFQKQVDEAIKGLKKVKV